MGSRTMIGLASAVAVAAAGAGALSAAAADPARSAAKPAKAEALFGVLLGVNELTADGKKGAGDPDGRGSASAVVDHDSGELCFGLTATGISAPTAAHIHEGKRKETGAPVITLTHPSSGDPGASSGCVSISEELANDLTKHPRRYYWNIHTPDYPGGAIRGQVFSKTR